MAERSVFRVAWLITKLEARRWLNRWSRVGRTKGTREATQRKGAPARMLLVFVSVALGFQALANSTRIVYGAAVEAERASAPGDAFVSREVLYWLDEVAESSTEGVAELALDSTFAGAASEEYARDPDERKARIAELHRVYAARGRAGFHETQLDYGFWPSPSLWFAGGDALVMIAPLAVIGFLLAISVLFFSVVGSDRDLARSDAALEWWFSFPVPTRGLMLARIFGTALVNPIGWLLLAPFFFVVFVSAGHGLGLLLALAATIYITTLGGCVRVLAETTLRRFLSPRRVSHVQAAIEVLAGAPFLAAVAATSTAGLHYVVTKSRGLPVLALYNPLSLPFAWLQSMSAIAIAALLLVATVHATSSIASAMLRDGLISASEPVLGSRERRAIAEGPQRSLWRLVAARELLSVVRDPARLARVVLVPLAMIGMTLLSDQRMLRAIVSEPKHASAAAFAIGNIVLLSGGLVTLANEGQGLWLLYTAPWSLDAILARRAALWSAIAGVCTLATLVVIALASGDVRFVLSGYALLALVGVGIYGAIAVALGALGTDVMESTRAHRIQPFTPQLFLLLSGMFSFALYNPSAWAKFAQLVLSVLFAFALWQKLRDHTPYFLDPTEAPPPAIAVADGIFAALGFFVLQGLLGFLFWRLHFSPGLVIVFSFTGAGMLASVAAVWTLANGGVPELARTLGLGGLARPLRTIALGAAGGLVASGCMLLYTRVVMQSDWLRQLYEESSAVDPTPDQLRWYAALAVGAAPLFEEILFRGVLYRGFRRSLNTRGAVVASALVFAIVHPALSFAPVFVMAVCAATVFELSGSLLAPILTHMIYNSIVVASALSQRP